MGRYNVSSVQDNHVISEGYEAHDVLTDSAVVRVQSFVEAG